MKFRVERDVLADAVAWAARSLPVRPSVPVLAGLLIETSEAGDGLVLSTFDYETSARATIPAAVQEEGKALVSGRLLADITRSLPNKPVDMEIDGAKVSLVCGSARFSLQTMPVDEYPALPAMPAATGTVKSDVFAAAVGQAVTAAGRDDMLPVLTGVRIEIEGDNIALLATDRFRLSLRELGWDPGATDASAAALVPARVLDATAKSLTSGTDVTIALAGGGTGEGLIGFEGSAGGGVRRTTTRLLDGEFPKVRTLLAIRTAPAACTTLRIATFHHPSPIMPHGSPCPRRHSRYPHHVTQRGNGGARDFFQRRRLCALSRPACRVLPRRRCGNLGMVPDAEPRAPDFGAIRRGWPAPRAGAGAPPYAGVIHARRKRTGHFWQGRFGCVAMDEAHLAAALRYASLTPVRARRSTARVPGVGPVRAHNLQAGMTASRRSHRSASAIRISRISCPKSPMPI